MSETQRKSHRLVSSELFLVLLNLDSHWSARNHILSIASISVVEKYGRTHMLPNLQNSGWTFAIIQESGSLLLLGYVLSRRRLRFRDLGLRWSLRDLGIGLIVAVASYLAYLSSVFPEAIGDNSERSSLIQLVQHELSCSRRPIGASVTKANQRAPSERTFL